MKFRNRALVRVGATVLLTTGTIAAISAPAFAAGTATDLELSVAGTKVAANAPGKVGWAKITNKGSNTPSALTIAADISDLDPSKVFVAPIDGDCNAEGSPTPTKWTCELTGELIPGPGETIEVPVITFKSNPGVTSYSAPVTFTISSPDDTNEGNNSKTVDVVLSEESGVDLGVQVSDVKDKLATPDDEPGTPLRAGDTTVVVGWVFNWGDAIAKGVRVTVQLPEHVTFAEDEPDCDYSADNRKAVCEYASLVLNPTTEEGEDEYVAAFYWPITVNADVEAPVTLPDGSWTVEALSQSPVEGERAARASGPLPKNVEMVSVKDTGVHEVDASDNVDGFVVVVDGDGGSGGGGGLPVTGAQAGLLGGIGLAVVIAGGVLFLLARRRRVVLVTPDDETPTA